MIIEKKVGAPHLVEHEKGHQTKLLEFGAYFADIAKESAKYHRRNPCKGKGRLTRHPQTKPGNCCSHSWMERRLDWFS